MSMFSVYHILLPKGDTANMYTFYLREIMFSQFLRLKAAKIQNSCHQLDIFNVYELPKV